MPELHPSPAIWLPQIRLAEELNSALPLEHTAVEARLTGPLAVVQVTQRFGNPLQEPAELDYLFPLPEEAAVTAFELRIGARRITGDLRELEAARDAYEQARHEGRRAGLLEQRRSNLFAVRLANVRPGETIYASLSYQQRLKFEDDAYEFIFPMGITPKYDSPKHPREGEGTHAPLADASEKIGPVEIHAVVDAGAALTGQPASPSHPLAVQMLDERRFEVRLAGPHIPDHDFVLRYRVAGDQVRAAAWTCPQGSNEIFLATLMPPRLEDEPTPSPREFIFVLDRSGSMTGEPIRQARNALRACLRTAGPEDTIRILLFDNELEWYRPEPFQVTQKELEQADAFLGRVEGRGGTEIVRAIEAALKLPPDPRRMRFVVFLTDGAVSAEERALDQVRSQIGPARVFTFGIGPSVNRALLSRMARLGRGRAEFLQLDEDIEGAIIRFQDSVAFPALTDLNLAWENAQSWDVYPARLPDLYAGQPLEICGFFRRTGGPVRLTLQGRRAGQAVSVVVTLPEPAAPGGDADAIARVWARARIDDLLEQWELEPSKAGKLRAEMLGLAVQYRLVTELTAFVAVDSAGEAAGGAPRVIHVAQPLPQGLNRGIFAGGPQVLLAAAAPSPAIAASGSGLFQAGLPRFMKRAKSPDPTGAGDGPVEMAAPPPLRRGTERAVPGRAEVEPQAGASRQEWLRLLARSQRADGSWGGDGEQTAAALLAFIRAGHTTRVGNFRSVLRKAVQWLKGQKLNGLADFVRARALAELAEATREPGDRQAAEEAHRGLPRPGNALEAAALEGQGRPPSDIQTLDDLRLAALLKTPLPVPPALFQVKDAALVKVWAAALG